MTLHSSMVQLSHAIIYDRAVLAGDLIILHERFHADRSIALDLIKSILVLRDNEEEFRGLETRIGRRGRIVRLRHDCGMHCIY